MLKLLVRSLVKPFYERNAGLFLVLAYLLFGAVEGSQLISYHYALLSSIASSFPLIAIILVACMLYGLKVYQFITELFKTPTYSFTSSLTILSTKQQLKIWTVLFTLLLAPVLLYSLLLLIIAAFLGYWINFITLLIALAAIIFFFSYLIYRKMNYSFTSIKNSKTTNILKVKKPFWLWPVFFLIEERPIPLLVAKLVSLLSFKVLLWMFADVGVDIRVYLTGLLGVILSHAIIIQQLLAFKANSLNFVKSVPRPAVLYLGETLLCLGIVALPEMVLFALTVKGNLMMMGKGLVFTISNLFFLYVLPSAIKLDMENYLKLLLLYFFCTMLAILAGWCLTYSFVLLCIALIYHHYTFWKSDWRAGLG